MATTTLRSARRFGSLVDETRLRILGLLRDGERCVRELTEVLGAGQSLLSFHLKALKDAGLVTDRREGRWVYYALDRQGLADMVVSLTRLTVPPPAPRKARRCP